MAIHEILCRECEEPVVKMGSQWYCQSTRCGRFSMPCQRTHMGYAETDEEYQEAAQREGEQREARSAQ